MVIQHTHIATVAYLYHALSPEARGLRMRCRRPSTRRSERVQDVIPVGSCRLSIMPRSTAYLSVFLGMKSGE